MIRILVPCDGSDIALHAVRHAVAIAQSAAVPVQIDVVHVLESAMAARSSDQRSLAAAFVQPHVVSQVPPVTEAILKPAIDILAQAGIPHEVHYLHGVAAPEIVAYARQAGCNCVIMCTRGRGQLANLVLGSVAAQVVHLIDIPVTLVK